MLFLGRERRRRLCDAFCVIRQRLRGDECTRCAITVCHERGPPPDDLPTSKREATRNERSQDCRGTKYAAPAIEVKGLEDRPNRLVETPRARYIDDVKRIQKQTRTFTVSDAWR